MSEDLNAGSRAQRIQVRLATTLAAWAVAYLIVLGLLVFFGHQLESLPPALNALVFTGVLVPLMGNLVMPILSVAVSRRVINRPRTREPERPTMRPKNAVRCGSSREPNGLRRRC